MMVSPPDFTPTEFRPTITQTVHAVRTAEKSGLGLDFGLYPINERIFRLLVEFKSLKENWDEDGALAPSPSAILQAENLIRLLQRAGEKVFHAAPGPNGEIMVDLRKNGKSVEILFYPTKARVVKFPIAGLPVQQDFHNDLLPEILKWLHE